MDEDAERFELLNPEVYKANLRDVWMEYKNEYIDEMTYKEIPRLARDCVDAFMYEFQKDLKAKHKGWSGAKIAKEITKDKHLWLPGSSMEDTYNCAEFFFAERFKLKEERVVTTANFFRYFTDAHKLLFSYGPKLSRKHNFEREQILDKMKVDLEKRKEQDITGLSSLKGTGSGKQRKSKGGSGSKKSKKKKAGNMFDLDIPLPEEAASPGDNAAVLSINGSKKSKKKKKKKKDKDR